VRRPLRRHSLAAIGRSTSSVPGDSLRKLRGRRRDRSSHRRTSVYAAAAAGGGREADGDPRGRRVLLNRRGPLRGGDAEAADGAGVVHLEPGDDAGGVVEVGAGELPRLGGEGQVLLADGAGYGGLGDLDRGQRGDGRGRGGGLPTPGGGGGRGEAELAVEYGGPHSGAVGLVRECGHGGDRGEVADEGPVEGHVSDEAADELARGLEARAEEVVVVIIVGVVGELGGGG